MKTLTVFLALAVFFTLTGCGAEDVEVTREVEVTRIVKETVIEQVEVTPVFDVEAEKEILESISEEIDNALTNADLAVLLRYFHEDLKEFYSTAEEQGVADRQSLLDGLVPGTRISSVDEEWIITPDLAVETYQLIWQLPDQPEERYYSTAVYKKEDGQWYLVHSHLTYIE
jgi:ketosteroid isomerase-like protein